MMDEVALRALVREIVSRHANRLQAGPPASRSRADILGHPSHARFSALSGPADGEPKACLIEPGVRCANCGYCESLGH